MDKHFEIAKQVVDALFEEAILWMHETGLDLERYNNLKAAMARHKVTTAGLSDEELAMLAKAPFWGLQGQADIQKKVLDKLSNDPEYIETLKSLMAKTEGHQHE